MKRKFFSMAICMMMASASLAQDVKYFKVGPYDVEFKDEYDYKFNLRKGVDLYNFYNLKKDTVIIQTKTEPLNSAWQVNASFAMPRFVANGTSNVFGVDASWKKAIGSGMWFNAGLSLGLSTGKYVAMWSENGGWDDKKDGTYSESIVEVGVPLSIEWARLDRKKASMYIGVGVTPTFYSGAKGKVEIDETTQKDKWTDESRSGIFVAPRVDLGGYIPAGKQLMRVGFFGQYDINCSTDGGDIFADRIGRFFVGGNIGLVF